MALFKKKKKDELKCPRDSTVMRKITTNGVTVDRCSKCGGIWLDKGEMKSIIENFEIYHRRKAKK